METSRLSWDDTWLEVAAVVARRSLCVRAQVGAVIVSRENRIVASGYNGPPAGFKHDDLPCYHWCDRGGLTDELATRSYDNCVALHSEANALSVCDRAMREGGTIYTTGHVCWSCAKLIANSGLAECVVRSVSADHREPEKSYEFLKRCGIEVVQYEPVT